MNRQELERIKSDIQYKIDNHIVNPKNGKYKIAYKFPGEDSSRRITVRGKDSTEIALKLIDARDERDLKEEEQKNLPKDLIKSQVNGMIPKLLVEYATEQTIQICIS